MFENVPKEAYWTLPLIIAVLGYFLRDAHGKIKEDISRHAIEISKKLDEERYNLAKIESKQEIENLKRDNKAAMDEIKSQQKQNFDFLFQEMRDQIEKTEDHLSQKLDTVLKFVQDKK